MKRPPPKRNVHLFRKLSNSIHNGVTFYRYEIHDNKGRNGFAAYPAFYTRGDGSVAFIGKRIGIESIGGDINSVDQFCRRISTVYASGFELREAA